MRLIDADARDDIIQILNAKKWDITRANYKLIDAVLSEFPTIEERQKGEWIDFAVSIKGVPTEACGECGEWSLGMGKHFCPNCGCQMNGGESGG